MKMMPALSSAERMAEIVLGFNSSPRSKRTSVFVDTLADAARSFTLVSRAVRAIDGTSRMLMMIEKMAISIQARRSSRRNSGALVA
jgi:predicted esterase YcpF (UPF0227 family)